ncbi:MAG: hypothetical protein WCA48_29190 [Pseudomonas gingeri]
MKMMSKENIKQRLLELSELIQEMGNILDEGAEDRPPGFLKCVRMPAPSDATDVGNVPRRSK